MKCTTVHCGHAADETATAAAIDCAGTGLMLCNLALLSRIREAKLDEALVLSSDDRTGQLTDIGGNRSVRS